MSLTRPARPTTAPPAPPPRRSLRPLLLRLHFYAGVLVAPFLLVAALSGMLYALSPQIEQAVHHDQLTTGSRGPTLPLDEQVDAARGARPDLPLLAVRPADGEGATTRVLLDDGRTDVSRRLAVFVDPVTGDVRGELTSYGGSGALPAQTWLSELHRNLHLGEPGRLYSELAASWLWLIAAAGLALWLTRRTRDGLSARARWRARLVPSRRGSPRARRLSRHGALGTWVLLGFMMLSATGLTWSTYAGGRFTELRTALDWSTPAVTADLASDSGATGHEGHEGHEGHDGTGAGTEDDGTEVVDDSPGVGYQAAYDAARAQDLVGPVEVTGPATTTGTYVIQELDESWPTQADAAAVDPASGDVVDVVRFADYPFMAKLAAWGIALHMGVLFGVWSQVALVLLAGALVAMILTGYRMWWQRRPTRSSEPRAGRGAWRSAPPAALAALALGALAIGWALPLLGLSLLGFLVLDALVGLVRRRAPSRQPEPVADAGRS